MSRKTQKEDDDADGNEQGKGEVGCRVQFDSCGTGAGGQIVQVAQKVEGAALGGVGGEGEEGDDGDIDRHNGGVLVTLLESGLFENAEKHGPHEEEGRHLVEEGHDEGRAENGGCEHPGPAVHEGAAHEVAGHPLGEVAVDDGGGQHEQEEDHDNHGVAKEHGKYLSCRSIAAEDEGHDAEKAGPYGIHEGPQVDDAEEDQRHDHARVRYAQKNAAVDGGQVHRREFCVRRHDQGKVGQEVAREHNDEANDGMDDFHHRHLAGIFHSLSPLRMSQKNPPLRRGEKGAGAPENVFRGAAYPFLISRS